MPTRRAVLLAATAATAATLARAAGPARAADRPPASGPPATAPTATAPAGVSPAARRAVEAVLAAPTPLRLSTVGRSADDHFRFRFYLTYADATNRPPVDLIVARENDDVAIVILGPTGLPYAYLSDGLMAGVDREVPGQFVVHEGGGTQFAFGATEAGGPNADFRYAARPTSPSFVLVDPAGLLRSLLTVAASGAADPNDPGAYRFVTRGSATVTVRPTKDLADARYPLASFAVVADDGTGLLLSRVELGRPKTKLAGRTLDDVRKLGLPVRRLQNKDVDRVQVSPAPDFGNQEGERAAAEKLRALLGLGEAEPRPDTPDRQPERP